MPLTTDMMGRSLQVPERPQRIVSLVPSQTELLADLGLEKEVVGITKFCVHPERWFREKARVGGTKEVKLEQLKALAPDLILANKEENVQEQIEALAEVAPVWLSDINSLEDALEMISRVGQLCGKTAGAARIRAGIEAGFARLPRQQARPLRVAYAIWRKPWMWVAADTFIDDLLARCGWVNVLRDRSRYPELSLEEMRRLQPEWILLSSEPYPFSEKHFAEVQAGLPGAKVTCVDGELFSWYGSRLLQTPEYLAHLIHAC